MLTVHNSEITDPTDIATNFNNFFANIGSTLADAIPHTLKTRTFNSCKVIS